MQALCAAIPLEGSLLIGGFVLTVWFGLLAFASGILRIWVNGGFRKLVTAHWLMLAYVVWVALSAVWSIDGPMTTSRAGSYAQLLVLVWLIWEVTSTEERLHSVLRAYCFGASLCAANTLSRLVTPGVVPGDGGRYAPKGFDQNELALLLSLSVPMGVFLLSRERTTIGSLLCYLHLILAATATLLTGSRAGAISLAGGAIAVAPVAAWMRGPKRTALAAALVAGAACASLVVPQATWERLLSASSELTGGTLDSRTIVWAAGIQSFREHPFLGVGAGAYAASVGPKIDKFYVAHNSFLSVLVELGVVGAMIFGLLTSSLAYLAVRIGGAQRWLWIGVLTAWALGAASLTWEYRKATWLVFALVSAHGAVHARRQQIRSASRRFAGRGDYMTFPIVQYQRVPSRRDREQRVR